MRYFSNYSSFSQWWFRVMTNLPVRQSPSLPWLGAVAHLTIISRLWAVSSAPVWSWLSGEREDLRLETLHSERERLEILHCEPHRHNQTEIVEHTSLPDISPLTYTFTQLVIHHWKPPCSPPPLSRLSCFLARRWYRWGPGCEVWLQMMMKMMIQDRPMNAYCVVAKDNSDIF